MAFKRRAIILVVTVICIATIAVILIERRLFSVLFRPKIYSAEKYEEIPERLALKLRDIGIWSLLPSTSFDIHLFADEWLEPTYFFSFRTSDESYWSFAEQLAGQKREQFMSGVMITRDLIQQGPLAYGISREEFPWDIAKGKHFERISCFVLVNEKRNVVNLCLWQPSGGTIEIIPSLPNVIE